MSVSEKVEKCFVETNWKELGKKMKKAIVYIQDGIEEQKNSYYKRKIKENEEKQKGNKDV